LVLLTNLTNIQTATAAYEQRTGIESMFKDCKVVDIILKDAMQSSSSICDCFTIAIAYTSAMDKH